MIENGTTNFLADAARFGIVDYVLLVGMLALSTGIGIYHACTGGRQKTTAEFLLADRSMSLLPVALSLLATFVSATTLLGVTSEIYTFGSQQTFLIINCFVLFPAVSYLFLPVYYDLGITSVNEYLERRFNKLIRRFAAGIYIYQTVIFMSIIVYSPALALSHATGLHFWGSVGVIIGICTLYTTIGGIKAVMWTDVLQSVVMIVAIFAIIIQGCINSGGFEYVWITAMKGKRVEFFNYSLDLTVRHTMWTQTLGHFFSTLPTYAVNQAQVQRYLSANSIKVARRALWGNLIGWIWVTASCCIMGFILYARYHDCDPVSQGIIQRNDQLLPLFAVEVLSKIPGFSGLFIAGLLSGSLSSLSTGLNSLAAVTYEDFLKNILSGKLSDSGATTVVKILAFGYGLLCLFGIGFVSKFATVSEAAIGIVGLLGGPTLGLFILGMFFPWTNSWGGGVGILSGLGISLWIKIGSYLTKPVIKRLPVSVAGCLANTTTSILTNYTVPLAASQTTPLITDEYTTLFTTESLISTPSTIEEIFSSSSTETTTPLMTFYSISYMWYSIVSCGITIFMGLIISFATGPRSAKEIDSRLFTPFAKYIMRNIPKKLRGPLRCDLVNETELDTLENDYAENLLTKKEITEIVTKC